MKNTKRSLAPTPFISRSPYARALLPHTRLVERFRTETQTHALEGRTHVFAKPLTFTPFASVAPCSARCRFCSETLMSTQTTTLSQTLRPSADYGQALRCALKALRGLPMGLSLSGLEATDNTPWLLDVLAALTEHAAHSPVLERVLYSNLNGIAGEDGALLLEALRDFSLTRVEASRHSHDAAKNNAIMRFREGTHARHGFDDAVRRAIPMVPVRLVCVLQRGGVDSRESVHSYLQWARSLGVRDVVFRELSRLGDEYQKGAGVRYVNRERVVLESLLAELKNDFDAKVFSPLMLTSGYYYWNVRHRYEDMEVTFETSDYSEMKKNHASGIVHKLIFHANGNLTGDWDPNTHVLLRTQGRDLVHIGR